MIRYHSTRTDKQTYTFSEAILKGIASDGGLLVPGKIPQVSLEQLQTLKDASYQEVAAFIFSLFETDFSKAALLDIILQAYSSNFDNEHITPVVHLKEDQYLLELWHGPTAAFKDLALQILPFLFTEAAAKNTPQLRYLILVATSGDTGKAALEGYKDKKGVTIMVLYPYQHVSKLQELQMATQEGLNVFVLAVKGDFDRVQKTVKDIFNDGEFNQKLLDKFNTVLSSANSINWGRLMPQIVYHFYGYLQLVNQRAITFGDTIDIAVPTGNFGNILAAFYAKKMGLPVGKFICASNTNNVLTEFLQTGVYDIQNRQLVQTPSPSMDILVASNIERLLYLISNDPEKVSGWMQELKDKKKFTVDEETRQQLQKEFYADWISNDECLETIKRVFEENSYIMDPHTAVAQAVAEKYSSTSLESPILICSTAHFSKFAKDVFTAVTGSSVESGRDEFELLSEIKKLAPEVYIPQNITALQNKPVLHTENSEAERETVEEKIVEFLRKSF